MSTAPTPSTPTCQQALDGQQDGAHVIQRRPLLLQDVEADVALSVHVGVVTGREEAHRGCGVGISAGELQGQFIAQLLVGLRAAVSGVGDREGGGGASCGAARGLTVPAAPSMVPIQRKRLSDSGKAEMPLSPDICEAAPSAPARPAPPLCPRSHSPSAPPAPAAACGDNALRVAPATAGGAAQRPPAPGPASPLPHGAAGGRGSRLGPFAGGGAGHGGGVGVLRGHDGSGPLSRALAWRLARLDSARPAPGAAQLRSRIPAPLPLPSVPPPLPHSV